MIMDSRWYTRRRIRRNQCKNRISKSKEHPCKRIKISNHSKIYKCRTAVTPWTTSTRTIMSTLRTSTTSPARISVKKCTRSNLKTLSKSSLHQNYKSRKFSSKEEKRPSTSMELYLNSSKYQRYTKYTLLSLRPIWKTAFCTRSRPWRFRRWRTSQWHTMKQSSKRICWSFNSNSWISTRIKLKTHSVLSIRPWPRFLTIISAHCLKYWRSSRNKRLVHQAKRRRQRPRTISCRSTNPYWQESSPSSCKEIIFWCWVTSQRQVSTRTSKIAVGQPRAYSTKSIPSLAIKKELWSGRSWILFKLWNSCSRSSSVRPRRYLGSSINSGKVRNLLKYSHSKRLLRCQRVSTRKDLSRHACSRRFCNSWVSKMK